MKTTDLKNKPLKVISDFGAAPDDCNDGADVGTGKLCKAVTRGTRSPIASVSCFRIGERRWNRVVRRGVAYCGEIALRLVVGFTAAARWTPTPVPSPKGGSCGSAELSETDAPVVPR